MTEAHEGVDGPAMKAPLIQVVVSWILCLLLAAIFLLAGGIKLIGRPNMVHEFNQVGIGQWFRYFTGILEVTGAVGLLIPKFSRWAAFLLVTVMAGAIIAHLTVLHSPPTLPGILLIWALTIAWLRR